MMLPQSSLISSSTNFRILISISDGVSGGILQPAWILPWFSDTKTRIAPAVFRFSTNFWHNQQSLLDIPISMVLRLEGELSACETNVSSQCAETDWYRSGLREKVGWDTLILCLLVWLGLCATSWNCHSISEPDSGWRKEFSVVEGGSLRDRIYYSSSVILGLINAHLPSECNLHHHSHALTTFVVLNSGLESW